MRDMICPRCSSENTVKNGNTVCGMPEFMCGDCRKHFVGIPDIRKIADEKKGTYRKKYFRKNFVSRNMPGTQNFTETAVKLYR